MIEMCPRCSDPVVEPHTCPYREEIQDDYTLCTCCPECESECNDDIWWEKK